MYSDEYEYSPTKAELIFALLKESILSSLVSLWDYNNCKLYLMLLFMCFLLTLLTLGSLLKIFFSPAVFLTEALQKSFFQHQFTTKKIVNFPLTRAQL